MSSEPVERLTWRMVRFNGREGGPAYVDLAEVAAVLDAPAADPGPAPELAVIRGAVICLKSGRAVFVKETAETVFDEVHRYRTAPPPAPPRMKTGTDGPNRDPAELAPVTLSDAGEEIGGPLPLKGRALCRDPREQPGQDPRRLARAICRAAARTYPDGCRGIGRQGGKGAPRGGPFQEHGRRHSPPHGRPGAVYKGLQ